MAFLLGTQSCIESLRSDLKDIQETIDEILVRTGPIKCYSWKSPDKLVNELNIKDLIDRYNYSSDEVDNQISHYSLLELIVDRLLLLIHISTLYSDTSLNGAENGLISNSKSTSLNAGLSTKKFWNKFTQLCSALRQSNSQNKSTKKQSVNELRSSKAVINDLPPKPSKPTLNGKESSSNEKIANEVSTKWVQTNETAFVPCESCAKIQNNLKQNADNIINMCHYQNINSQVGKFRTTLMANQLVGGWLNGDDLNKWLLEQDKDLTRIGKQLEFLSKNNELLKTKLADNESLVTKMANAEKDLKKALKEEQETKNITIKQYEKKLTDQKSELNSKIAALDAEVANLNKIKSTLEEKYETLKNLNENNEKIIIELNETNKTLSSEVNLKNKQNDKCQTLEEERLVLRKELECLKRELADKTNDLNSERSKLENLIREEQSLRLKHEATLESMDKLAAQNDELKKKSNYIDEEKKQLLENIKHKEGEIETLKYDNEILQSSIDSLNAELKKRKESEHLLLKYPDLYGTMEHVGEDHDLGVEVDMQNQINANKHRIYLLNNLNKKLENSIKKLHETKSLHKQSSLDSNPDQTINEEKSYFKKQSSIVSTPKNQPEESAGSRLGLNRPVPLFKLENEIDQLDDNMHKTNSNDTQLGSNNQYWNQENSILTPKYNNDQKKSNSYSDLGSKNIFKHSTVIGVKTYEQEKLDLENDENYDFLKDKHESDKNFLSKLNQISHASELIIENTDFSMLKGRRASSRDHQTTFLYSPSQSSMNSESNQNRDGGGSGGYHSNLNSSMSNRNQSRLKSPFVPNIPPADKNMEVVVGKGKRVSSAAVSVTGSARSNSATSNNRKNSIPIPPSSANSNRSVANKNTFACENCNKKYSNGKDLDIHKMYCN